MNSWSIFLSFAKNNPTEIPKSIQSRSKIYKNYKELCMCGSDQKICSTLKLESKCKQPKKVSYNPHKDPVMLQAKIKAYEDILADKDEQIKHFEKYFSKSKKSVKSI